MNTQQRKKNTGLVVALALVLVALAAVVTLIVLFATGVLGGGNGGAGASGVAVAVSGQSETDAPTGGTNTPTGSTDTSADTSAAATTSAPAIASTPTDTPAPADTGTSEDTDAPSPADTGASANTEPSEEEIAEQNFRDSHGGYSREELIAYLGSTMWAKDGDENSAVLDFHDDGTFIALQGMGGVVEATGTYRFEGEDGVHAPLLFRMYREDGSLFTEFEIIFSHQLQGELVLLFQSDMIYRQIY